MVTFKEAALKGIPFWDEASPGELCMVPCWPLDLNGDAADCKLVSVIVGIVGQDGLLRSEEMPAFDPSVTEYLCSQHLRK